MELSTSLNIYSLLGNTNTPDRMIKAVKVCSECGYKAVDLYLKGVLCLSEGELDQWIDDMQRTLAECGVRVSQCHLYFGKVDKDNIQDYEDKIAKTMAVADRMGIEWGVIHGIDYGKLFGMPLEENIRLNVELFKRLQERVKPKTVGLAFENIMTYVFAAPEVLIAICEESSKYGKVGVCWDTGHAHLSEGIDQGESIRKLGDWLKCLHIHDNHGKNDEHIFPMMGTIDWHQIMDALRDINYKRDFVYESAQPTKYLPEDDILRIELIKYSVKLGNYLLENF